VPVPPVLSLAVPEVELPDPVEEVPDVELPLELVPVSLEGRRPMA
jgi:hypothetical protein